MRNSTSLLTCLVAVLATSLPLAAQSVPPSHVVETIVTLPAATPNSAPYDFGFIPDDGRMIILCRGGLLYIVAAGGGTPVQVGTIPAVESGSERGALSIAIDPNFAANHYIYVWFAHSASSFMRLSRFELGGTDIANPAGTNVTLVAGSERQIIADAPDNAFNHNGGSVRFGPDGMAYLSIGDDASSCDAQNRNTLTGVLLRMTFANLPAGGGAQPPRSTLIPADNPDAGNANSNAALGIAFGLRNPVTMNIDPVTGDIYVADVGQNAREEINRWPRNMTGTMQVLNFGWPWREGIASFSSCAGGLPPNLIDPIDDYAQSSGGVSIMTGGIVRNLPGQQFLWTAAYENNVFHVDYFSGTMERLVNVGGNWQNAAAVPGQFSTNWWGGNFTASVHFQQYNGTAANPGDGAIYFCQHTQTYGTQGGFIKRIRPAAPMNQVLPIQGDNAFAIVNSPFDSVLEVEVRDPTGATPLPGLQVTFTAVTGAVTFSTPNVVTTNAFGRAQVSVVAGANAGTASVRATVTGGDTAGHLFSMFAGGFRVLDIPAGVNRTQFFVVTTKTNQTAPISVPYVVLAGVPQMPISVPLFGSLCIDPFNPALTIVVADGLGIFGTPSLFNPVGNPNLSRSVSVPAAAVSGATLIFNAIAYDASMAPSTFGFILYNCVTVTYP